MDPCETLSEHPFVDPALLSEGIDSLAGPADENLIRNLQNSRMSADLKQPSDAVAQSQKVLLIGEQSKFDLGGRFRVRRRDAQPTV